MSTLPFTPCFMIFGVNCLCLGSHGEDSLKPKKSSSNTKLSATNSDPNAEQKELAKEKEASTKEGSKAEKELVKEKSKSNGKDKEKAKS